MTLLSEAFIGSAGHPRYITVLETPFGMLQNEEYLTERIKGGEQASYDFILEIAESTLPFRNVANLLQNLINYTEWTPETANLRAICDQIIVACEKAFEPGAVPATMGSCYHGKGAAPFKVDGNGRDQKYYPHTYEAILRPHMIPTLDHTFKKIAAEREERAWKWRQGYRKWDHARCDAENAAQERQSRRNK
jgi:hypothetical protein